MPSRPTSEHTKTSTKARFRGWLAGHGKNATSRLGSEASGIQGRIEGFSSGVKIIGHVEERMDRFDIYITSGTSDRFEPRFVGSVLQDSPFEDPKFIRWGEEMPD